jgi:hypothetical protein
MSCNEDNEAEKIDEKYFRKLATAVYEGRVESVETMIDGILIMNATELVLSLCEGIKKVASIECILERSSHMEDVEHMLILIIHEKQREKKK